MADIVKHMPVLLTVSELATLLRVKPGAIYMMNKRGTGPEYMRVAGGSIRYDREKVLEYLRAKREGGKR